VAIKSAYTSGWSRMRRVNRLEQETAAGKPISLFVVDRLYIWPAPGPQR
jgi:hypothetical protein